MSDTYLDFIAIGGSREGASASSAERQLEVKSLSLLEVVDDVEQISSLGVTSWTWHAHQTLRGPFCSTTQLSQRTQSNRGCEA
jgi:hypothetical protein